MQYTRAAGVAAAVVALVAGYIRAAEPPAAEAGAKSKFLRFVDDNEGGGRLETAIVTYRNDAGVTVDLIGAVHVAEAAYYKLLREKFTAYDALLYELIKPAEGGAAPVEKTRSTTFLATLQQVMKDVLELEFQLDHIDYNAPNFVHADLDLETFQRLQAERGENIFMLMLRQMLADMNRPRNVTETTLTELLIALLSPDRARHLKLLLAKNFEDIEEQMAALEGPGGSVILTERNKAAIRVLDRTIAAGKKKIGLFYGAAHMNDLEKRVKEMGFRYVRTQWLTAWDMTAKEGDLIITVKKRRAPQPQEEQK